MIIGKLLVVCVKGVGKLLNSKVGKKVSAVGVLVGVGLTGSGINKAVKAKKNNKRAYAIQEKALSIHENKLRETNNNIANLGIEEKRSIELIDSFMKFTEKIERCPSMNEIESKIELPTFTPIELKKMSKGLELALIGSGGVVAGALPGLVFCGASLSTLGLAALGGGVVLSIKGSKLTKEAANNVEQANNITIEVDEIVEFYRQVDGAAIKLKEAISKINEVYSMKLDKLETLVKKNSDYETYSKNEAILVKNAFKLTILLANMCKTKLARRVKEVEYINTKEIDFIVQSADQMYKETKKRVFGKAFM